MGVIEEIYADLDDPEMTEEAFREAVEAKVEQMGGLANEETAAMLIAHELSDQQVNTIADIEPGMEEVKFLSKVVSIGTIREFEREESEESGRVVNVEVADETGRLRAAFWDEQADAAVDELEPGQVLRIHGRPRDGYNGVEVSVTRAEIDEEADIDVPIAGAYHVEDLTLGLSDVTLRGQILDTDSVRTFTRDDGSEGRVANLSLGDETGRVRVTLWDEKADLVTEFDTGESVEIVDGYVRDRDGTLELHVGNRGAVNRIDESIDYVSDATPIESVEIGETVDLAGVVRSADPKRTFDRDDGTEGQVRNIRVQDTTGDIRVALWGAKADIEITPGDEVQLGDVEIKEGWQEDFEASAGWQSTVTVRSAQTGESTPTVTSSMDDSESSAEEPGLGAFIEASSPEPAAAAADPDEPISTEFTGVVVQAGNPVVLDDGEQTVSVDTDATVNLGEEVTVRGRLHKGRLDADEVI